MADFRYKTKMDQNPQGKQKVYFTCHPEDFEATFDEIKKDIFDRQDVAIFYLDSDALADDVDDYELRLGEMQLFVIPVTTKLLTRPNRAMDLEIPFAQEHHIPILPLMREKGLDELFNVKFGGLQYLDKFNTDPTAIPFDEKLTKYLESVIIGDELAQQVRAAFDAYIFLSYRKKDRGHAQELMKLIHENDFARDIAIWYDEFLTPGEDFNSAIKAALAKSDLFALTVTPNLLEMPNGKPNFVMDKEFPAARDSGKPILPAEMLETDRDALNEKYTDIPEPVGGEDKTGLSERLSELLKKLAITENEKDIRHNYFIGLAYLNGIDVEKNTQRAVKLIKGCSDQKYIPAMEKLASMFENGEGVERDLKEYSSLLSKLLEEYKAINKDSPSEENTYLTANTALRLGEAYRLLLSCDNEIKTLTNIDKFLESCKFDSDRITIARIICQIRLGDAYKDFVPEEMRQYYDNRYNYFSVKSSSKPESLCKTALKHYEAAMNAIYYLKSSSEPESRFSALYYEGLYYHKRAQLTEEEYGPDSAFSDCFMGCKVCEKLADVSNTSHAIIMLCQSYRDAGKCRVAQERYDDAYALYYKSFSLCAKLAEDIDSSAACYCIIQCCHCLGDLELLRFEIKKAEEWYKTALQAAEDLCQKSETFQNQRALAVAYGKLGDSYFLKDQYDKAREWYEKSYQLLNSVKTHYGTTDNNRDLVSRSLLRELSESCRRLCDAARASGDWETAFMWNDLRADAEARAARLRTREEDDRNAQIDLEYVECFNWIILLALSDEEVDNRIQQNNELSRRITRYLVNAESDFSWCFNVIIAHSKSGLPSSQRNLALLYERLAQYSIITKRYIFKDEWFGYYKDSLKIYEALMYASYTPRSMDDYARICYLAGKKSIRTNLLSRAHAIWYELERRYPDVPRFKRNKQEAFKEKMLRLKHEYERRKYVQTRSESSAVN